MATNNGNSTTATIMLSQWEVTTAKGVFSLETKGISEKTARKDFNKKFPGAGKIIGIKQVSKQGSTIAQQPQILTPIAQPIDVTKIESVKVDTANYIDYLPSKVVHNCMLIIEGDRVDHPEGITACGVGKLFLQISSKRIEFGDVKTDSVVLNQSVFELPEKTNDAISYEDIIAIKLEVEKMWCLGAKVEIAKQKAHSKKSKDAAKKAKMQAMSAIL